MSKIYILEDDPNRMRYFDREFKIDADEYVHADNAAGMIELIEADSYNADPIDVLFLDHDLGGEQFVDSSEKNTGMGVVRWLVEHKPEIRLIIVHTLNPPAGLEMVQRLQMAGYDNVVRAPFTEINFSGNLYEAVLSAAGIPLPDDE